MKLRQLPQGVQDYLPEECYNKNAVEKHLSDFFFKNGFDRVEPSAIEFVDAGERGINKLFKFVDIDGSLLALRSDPTAQLARISVAMEKKSLRGYYLVNSYEFLPSGSFARTREFSQCGVELIGEGSDVEAVVLAIGALSASGIKNFKLDIGDSRFIYGIMKAGNLNEKQIDFLTPLINDKKVIEIEDFFIKNNIDFSLYKKISKAVQMFGGKEMLIEAEKLADNPISRVALDGLISIANTLENDGTLDNSSFDLAFVSQGYYSGLIMRGYARCYGLILLEGGRYDNMCDKFGFKNTSESIPAVGFAIGIKRLMTALELQGITEEIPKIDAAYITDGSCALEVTEKYNRVIRLFSTKKDALLYADKNNIPRLFSFLDGKMEILKGGK